MTLPYLTAENRLVKQREWIRRIEAGARVRRRIDLDPARVALLIVDPLNAFTDPRGSAYLPSSPVVIESCRDLARHFSLRGRPVYVAAHCHRSDPGLFGLFYKSHIACGSFDAGLSGHLQLPEGAITFAKSTYDCFYNTSLAEDLDHAGCDHLVVCGVLTHLCVESTVRGAFSRGIVPFVVLDATCSRTEELHLAALLTMSDGCAIPRTAEEVMSRVP